MGQTLKRHTHLRKELTRQFPKQAHGMGTGDVVMAYLRFLCRVTQAARRITNLTLLVRLNSGNDAMKSHALRRKSKVDFAVKHNWRRGDPAVREARTTALELRLGAGSVHLVSLRPEYTDTVGPSKF